MRSISMDTWQEEQIRRMQVSTNLDSLIIPMIHPHTPFFVVVGRQCTVQGVHESLPSGRRVNDGYERARAVSLLGGLTI